MDWVHCNSCYIQPGDEEKKKFFITNCGHIYCDECLRLNQSNECRICHIKYNTIPLGANMNSDVEVYFHDPVANLKKQIKILEFQQSHRVRLVSHNRDRIRSYRALKKENYNLNEQLKLCQQENSSLRNEIKRIKADLYEEKQKYKMSEGGRQLGSQHTPQLGSLSQLLGKENRRTPTMPANIYQEKEPMVKFSPTVKRTPSSNFFTMTEAEPARKGGRMFTTPELPAFPGTYRSHKTLTPDVSTPPTPESLIRECSQRDPLQRKIKLPGSRSGPSPLSRLSFQGLTLSRPTSTPNKETLITNKYLKYFK